MRKIRNIIIVICSLILVLSILLSIPNFKEKYDDTAIIYDINKKIKIDNSTLKIERIISEANRTYLEYKFVRLEQGWSFPGNAIEIGISKENLLSYSTSYTSGKLWGEQGTIQYDLILEGVDELILSFNHYDRSFIHRLKLED